MKSITLCADDYGQNTAISQAIITLLREKRLSAVSCMTSMPQWLEHAAWLTPFKAQADIGLHFNLTQGKPLSSAFIAAYGETFPSLPTLLRKCYLRQLNKNAVLAELLAQLEQFVVGTGHLPDFIDGHQHIHQLPVIRRLLIDVYRSHLKKHHSYIRCTYHAKSWFRFQEPKRIIIQLCGAFTLKRLLLLEKIPHNGTFSGVYHFAATKRYADLFTQFLRESEDGGLIMCHPGLEIHSPEDEIAASRPLEYGYFSGAQFLEACNQENVVITRFNREKSIAF
jgi:hypothetical protein